MRGANCAQARIRDAAAADLAQGEQEMLALVGARSAAAASRIRALAQLAPRVFDLTAVGRVPAG